MQFHPFRFQIFIRILSQLGTIFHLFKRSLKSILVDNWSTFEDQLKPRWTSDIMTTYSEEHYEAWVIPILKPRSRIALIRTMQEVLTRL